MNVYVLVRMENWNYISLCECFTDTKSTRKRLKELVDSDIKTGYKKETRATTPNANINLNNGCFKRSYVIEKTKIKEKL